jgi:hypothetical protein
MERNECVNRIPAIVFEIFKIIDQQDILSSDNLEFQRDQGQVTDVVNDTGITHFTKFVHTWHNENGKWKIIRVIGFH